MLRMLHAIFMVQPELPIFVLCDMQVRGDNLYKA